MDTLARHFLVELRGCRADLLNQPDTVKDLLRRAATEAGATIVAEVVHAYSPHGVTGVEAQMALFDHDHTRDPVG